MVWSLVGDALNRYVQKLCICVIGTFVDDFSARDHCSMQRTRKNTCTTPSEEC